jgi:hypothetical protein
MEVLRQESCGGRRGKVAVSDKAEEGVEVDADVLLPAPRARGG